MNTQLSLNLPRQPLPRQHRAETRQRDSLSSSETEEAEAESSSSASSSASESSDMSIDGSCVSSDAEEDSAMSSPETIRTAAEPVAAAPMVLAGCPRCLMYVMLSDSNPKCPKCKSTVLLDFLNQR
uniref:GIR1-like zinc ribbon domain-containing protein n=1 Tax=Cannabis sativa TaxID=3483 RepID=A0A803R3C6_CANSA